jgi:hypothetical protein
MANPNVQQPRTQLDEVSEFQTGRREGPCRPVTAPTLFEVREFQTRFLFPFDFARGSATSAAEVLIADTSLVSGRLWRRDEPHFLYTDEFFEPVVRYLFPDPSRPVGAPKVECEYLVADEKELERWFKAAEVRLPSGVLQVGPNPVAEVFLTAQGVGLLSVALGVTGPFSMAAVADFNYRLSQFRRRPVTGLIKPHPTEDPKKYDSLSADNRARIARKPPTIAPVEEQLASPYGSFTLEQLIVRLVVKPLRDLQVQPVEPRELAVYTVVRLTETDFADPVARAILAPQLSRLAQIEEVNHPGPDPADPTVSAAVLNRRHWAAVGMLGAAHLVADETGENGVGKGFNDQRMRIVRDKYFVSFLVPLLQRMTLNRAAKEASEIFTASAEDRATRTAQLRRELLRFGVGGQFNQINNRHAHHRYYQLCRAGLDVIPAWQDVRQILGEWDADRVAEEAVQIRREQTEQQKKLGEVAENVAASVTEIGRLQSVVHIIEYLLGSVYGAHLLHMALTENHTVEHWASHLGFNRDGYMTAVTVLGAALGFAFVAGVNAVRRRCRDSTPGPTSPTRGSAVRAADSSQPAE